MFPHLHLNLKGGDLDVSGGNSKGQSLQQTAKVTFQGASDGAKLEKREVALAALHPSHVAAIQPGLQSEVFLREAGRLARGAYALAQYLEGRLWLCLLHPV